MMILLLLHRMNPLVAMADICCDAMNVRFRGIADIHQPPSHLDL